MLYYLIQCEIVTSLPKLTCAALCLTLLQFSCHCQENQQKQQKNNARSYDTNDWIPMSQPYQNGNQNFPQLHAVHAKNHKVSENKQYPELAQVQNPTRQNHYRKERLHDTHQVLLSPPPPQALPLTQELPYLHKQQPFISQVRYEEPNIQASQQNVPQITQNIVPPPQAEQLQAQQDQPQQEKEEIQLLYVPLETLRQREQRQRFQQDHSTAQSQLRFVDQQSISPQSHKQNQLKNIEQDFIQQAVQAHKLQQQFQQYPQEYPTQIYQSLDISQYPHQQIFDPPSTQVPTTTAAPVKKRKPHQPPLAVYMGTDGHQDITASDVLEILKDAKTITVQDYISEDSPRVFVGPSNLQAPQGFVKFGLPYLSSFDKHQREGLHKIPFFVAPLNYRTPPGYSKIPFPSPHVGSVVINQRNQEGTEKPTVKHPNLLSNQQLNQKNNQLLYSETSTVASNNKNRQVFSDIFPPPTSASNIPYGPLPTRQEEQSYSTQRPVVSSQLPVSSTSRPYYSTFEPQLVTATPNNFGKQFSQNHRFTTGAPSTESVTYPSQLFSVTTNRNPTRQQQNQRPQVSLSTPDNYYDTTRTKTPNRYLPEVQQQQITTTKQFLAEEVTPRNQHRLTDSYNNDKQTQNIPTNLSGFEAVKANLTSSVEVNDQEYKPTYQTHNSPNQFYEFRTERTRQKVEENPRVVTESTYFNSNIKPNNQHIIQNQQYHVPQVTAQQVLQDVREKEPDQYNQQQYLITLAQPESNLYQQIPQQVTHRFVFKQEKPSEPPTFITTERQKVQEYVQPVPQEKQPQQTYKLPNDLPISPQLPSLVNSLEDQAIRPLLAPLLLPTAEEADENYIEHTSQQIVSTTLTPEPITVTTESVVTPEVETTTPYRRLRGKLRATRPTNSPVHSSTRSRPSISINNRGRKPYQEQPQVDSTTRSTSLRNRHNNQRERQQHPSSTTEVIKEQPVTYQKRFRTRGRPVKLEEEFAAFTDRTSTERLVETQPSVQYSTQNVYVAESQESSTENDRKAYFTTVQNDQPLTYLINGQHLINQNIQGGEEPPTIYILNEEPVEDKTERAQVIKEIVKPTEEPHKSVQATIDQSQYLVETTKPRTRTRVRTRTRTSTTAPSTTTAARKESEEESQEFYGFFRQPVFKPLKMEYKSSSDMRSTLGPIQHTTFAPTNLNQPDYESDYYSSNNKASTPRVYHLPDEDAHSEADGESQYSSSKQESSEETYKDIKPFTIRTTPARQRYVTTAQPIIQERVTNSPERYYSSRPKQRTETQSHKTTRIRGRIRRPTTQRPEKQISSEENYSTRPHKEIASAPRTRSRGKTHFKLTKEGETDEDISENYPPSFLKSQERTPRPTFKLTVEPDSGEEQEGAYSTHPKTKSRDLVKGEESQRHEKTIEGPNSIAEDKTTIDKEKKLDDVKIYDTENIEATSPMSEKLVETTAAEISTERVEDLTEQSSTEISTETEIKAEEDKMVADQTTYFPAYTTENVPTTKKSRRRGVWKLVAHRPIDMFQPAESQNVGTVVANNLFDDEKTYKIDKDKIAAMLTGQTEESQKTNENETINSTTTEGTTIVPTENITEQNTAEPVEIIDSNENMEEDDTTEKIEIDEAKIDKEDKGMMSFFDQFISSFDSFSTTTQKPNKSIDKYDFWKSKIIGTSTTTEVSHETEICYKGRCIKSVQ